MRGRPGTTSDGRRVRLLANIGRPEEIDRALAAGAEGVGLFRTEFLFLGRIATADEDEQAGGLRDGPRGIRPRPPGRHPAGRHRRRQGDPVPGPPDRRRTRSSASAGSAWPRARPDLLVTQLRAIGRAAAATGTSPHVMAPMVATVGDVDLFDELRDEAAAIDVRRPRSRPSGSWPGSWSRSRRPSGWRPSSSGESPS